MTISSVYRPTFSAMSAAQAANTAEPTPEPRRLAAAEVGPVATALKNEIAYEVTSRFMSDRQVSGPFQISFFPPKSVLAGSEGSKRLFARADLSRLESTINAQLAGTGVQIKGLDTQRLSATSVLSGTIVQR